MVQKFIFFSLGSNVGDREANIRAAIDRMKHAGEIVEVSSIYETEPVDLIAQPWFLNAVGKMITGKMPKQLLASILRIEQSMGRKRDQQKGPRIIDIDILLFADSVIDAQGLTIPHPSMHLRRFVLEPLAEIAPGLRHPVFKRTIRELLNEIPPGQVVRRQDELHLRRGKVVDRL